MKAASRKGFTLIEILIVVIILGILAAIVIPQFTSASDDAKLSSIRSTVQSVRGQIELYKLQHNEEYPTTDGALGSAWDWDKLTKYTDVAGNDYDTKTAAQTAADALDGKVYGPYMQEVPANPFTGLTAVGIGTTVANVGWNFDVDGRFWGIDKAGTGLVTMQNVKGASGSN